MSTYHVLTPAEKARLANRRAANPSAPLTEVERSVLRQCEKEGRAQSLFERLERQAAREAAVPEHERRPINYARVVYERRLAFDRPGERQSSSFLNILKKQADDEDKRIDALMEQKRVQHLVDTDPDVQNAIEHAEHSLKLAGDDDREARAKAVGLAKEGDVKAYWAQARLLNMTLVENEKARQVELATGRTAADAAYLEQKQKTDKAVLELKASMSTLKQSLETPIE